MKVLSGVNDKSPPILRTDPIDDKKPHSTNHTITTKSVL